MRKKLAKLPVRLPHGLVENMPPEQTVSLLDQGNLRFTQGLRAVSSSVDIDALQPLVTLGQHPIATVLTCSDSRLPTETVFNLGLGSLYVLRVAGNVLTDLTLAGIEYSVRSFNVPLVLVLGHTHCGAIKTARERKFGIFQSPSTHISTLLDCVEPSLEHELNERAIARNNVIHQMGKVKANSPFVEGLVSQGALKVMGAVYDMETGRVTFMRG